MNRKLKRNASVAFDIGMLIGALWLMASICHGQTPTPTPDPKPDYYVTISNEGWAEAEVRVFNFTEEHWLGRVKVKKWAEVLGRLHTDTLNDKRHLALNGVAAVVAGADGGREHSIASELDIVTYEEGKNQKGVITLTIEQGTGFAILKDATKGNIYLAEIMTISPEKLKEAISVKP
jgi:hypothetical protein